MLPQSLVRRCAWLCCLGCSLWLGGCVTHRTTVNPGDPAAEVIVMSATTTDHPVNPVTAQGGLPQEIPVTAWRRDDDGALYRADTIVRTPLPWWQRFPADIVTDALTPKDYVSKATWTPVWTQPTTTNTDELTARARAAGYASSATE